MQSPDINTTMYQFGTPTTSKTLLLFARGREAARLLGVSPADTPITVRVHLTLRTRLGLTC